MPRPIPAAAGVICCQLPAAICHLPVDLRRLPDPDVLLDVGGDVRHGAARPEDAPDADRLQLRDVHVRDDPADHHQHVVEPLLPHEFHQPRADLVVGARQDGEADDVGVFLHGRRDDLLGGLAEAGVDHFHAGVPQRAGDHLGAAVVSVQARLGDDDADLPHRIGTSSYSPQTSRSASHISPTVA
jgi:hypothetical protein